MMSKTNPMVPKENGPQPIRFEQYLSPADIDLLQCVDERQTAERTTNGIEIPGGIYGVLDAVKYIRRISEDEARRLVERAAIPIGAHVDEHHGERGCGYAKLVETNPTAVSAVEAIPAADRLHWVTQMNGHVLHYVGEHHPTHAVINHRTGYSIDSDLAWKERQLGVFSCDVWAAGLFAVRLAIDPKHMMGHVEQMYRQTVAALSSITQFEVIQ